MSKFKDYKEKQLYYKQLNKNRGKVIYEYSANVYSKEGKLLKKGIPYRKDNNKEEEIV